MHLLGLTKSARRFFAIGLFYSALLVSLRAAINGSWDSFNPTTVNVGDAFSVSGWAVDTSTSTNANVQVQLKIDNNIMAQYYVANDNAVGYYGYTASKTTQSRPDVGNIYGSNYTNICGWQITVNTSNVSTGQHVLTVWVGGGPSGWIQFTSAIVQGTGTLNVGSGSTTIYLQDDPNQYGAFKQQGDPQANAQTNQQTLLNAINHLGTGSTLVLPSGTYQIKYGGMTVNAANCTIKSTRDSNGVPQCHLIATNDGGAFNNWFFDLAGSGQTLDGLWLDSTIPTTRRDQVPLVGIRGQSCTVKNCWLDNAMEFAVTVTPGANGAVINNNTITQSRGDSIHVYSSSNVTVSQNYISYPHDDAIAIEGSYPGGSSQLTKNVSVSNNTISHALWRGIAVFDAEYVTVSNNIVYGSASSGIEAHHLERTYYDPSNTQQPRESGPYLSNIKINLNQLYDVGAETPDTISHSGANVDHTDAISANCITSSEIYGNYITRVNRTGITFSSYNTLSIHGNQIYYPGKKVAASAAIRLLYLPVFPPGTTDYNNSNNYLAHEHSYLSLYDNTLGHCSTDKKTPAINLILDSGWGIPNRPGDMHNWFFATNIYHNTTSWDNDQTSSGHFWLGADYYNSFTAYENTCTATQGIILFMLPWSTQSFYGNLVGGVSNNNTTTNINYWP